MQAQHDQVRTLACLSPGGFAASSTGRAEWRLLATWTRSVNCCPLPSGPCAQPPSRPGATSPLHRRETTQRHGCAKADGTAGRLWPRGCGWAPGPRPCLGWGEQGLSTLAAPGEGPLRQASVDFSSLGDVRSGGSTARPLGLLTSVCRSNPGGSAPRFPVETCCLPGWPSARSWGGGGRARPARGSRALCPGAA